MIVANHCLFMIKGDDMLCYVVSDTHKGMTPLILFLFVCLDLTGTDTTFVWLPYMFC